MIRLQTFTLLVLVGLTQTQSIHAYHEASFARNDNPNENYEKNSFPYYHFPLGLNNNDDLYTSSVVSLSSGPLCSGFHIRENSVVTAASCVFRETAKNLVVFSHNSNDGRPELLPVEQLYLNKNYDFNTGEHDLAVLVVRNISMQMPILKLPRLGSGEFDDTSSNVFMAKYLFGSNMLDFSTVSYPVDASMDTKKCTDKNPSNQVFLCVSKMDKTPFSYGLADLGTPLIYKGSGGVFVSGIFTGHSYNVPKTHYLYQNVYANLEFLRPFASN